MNSTGRSTVRSKKLPAYGNILLNSEGLSHLLEGCVATFQKMTYFRLYHFTQHEITFLASEGGFKKNTS